MTMIGNVTVPDNAMNRILSHLGVESLGRMQSVSNTAGNDI